MTIYLNKYYIYYINYINLIITFDKFMRYELLYIIKTPYQPFIVNMELLACYAISISYALDSFLF